jgi:hypothetical protein
MLLSCLWNNTASNALVERTAFGLQEQVDKVARTTGLLRRWRYMNYAHPGQDVIGSYGEENVRFLREMSQRYDPDGVFQKTVTGGFKLGV